MPLKRCLTVEEAATRINLLLGKTDEMEQRVIRLEALNSYQWARMSNVEANQRKIVERVDGLCKDVEGVKDKLTTCMNLTTTLVELVKKNKDDLVGILKCLECLNCELCQLSCALCALRGAIIAGKIFAFVVGFIMGMGAGAAISGGASGGIGLVTSVPIW